MRTRAKDRFSSHVNKSKLILSSDAERTRRQLTAELQKAYGVASSYARGRIRYVVGDNGKQHPITLAERRFWLLVAAHTAQLINSLAQGINEQRLYQDLNALGAMLREATAHEGLNSRLEPRGLRGKKNNVLRYSFFRLLLQFFWCRRIWRGLGKV